MSRALSYAHAYAVARECVFTYQAIFDGNNPLDFYRPALASIGHKLVFCRRVFIEMGWHTAHPEFFLPIADAVISHREAVKSKFIDRDGLLCACHYLERILLIDPRKGGRHEAA